MHHSERFAKAAGDGRMVLVLSSLSSITFIPFQKKEHKQQKRRLQYLQRKR